MDPSVTAIKFPRKRKKYPAETSSNNTSKKKKLRNSDDSKKFLKKEILLEKKNIKSQVNSNTDFQNPDKYVNINMAKEFKKKPLKIKENTNTKSQSVHSKQVQKAKKVKEKFKKVPGSNKQGFPSISKDTSTSFIVKKGKKKIKNSTTNLEESIISESEDELSDFCISDGSESDEEVLREEILNSSIFRQIKKLMKKAPHLNPANAPQDSNDDKDNSSDLNSSLESDNELALGTDNQASSSLESNPKDSNLKNKTINKKQDKNALLSNKMSNVTESTIFNRTSKDNALRRNTSNKEKRGEMSSNLKNKVQEKLAGAKFRFLNEKLYTETGKEAFKYFQENTEEFDDYHSGYRLQVSKWPINPVNEIIADIQKLKKKFVIADLGCGEAKIAQAFPDRTIHSFDLVPLNEFVQACDISKVPLPNESVDVVVFCLSLMGTNLKDYLCEAFRILKMGGILKIAEVESRIDDMGHFISYLKSMGFTPGKKNTKHKMFVFLDLKKEKCKLGKVQSLSLRPCLYKKR